MERGSLTGVRTAVANLPAPPPLDDALVICLLLRDQEPDRYERAALNYPVRAPRVLDEAGSVRRAVKNRRGRSYPLRRPEVDVGLT
jgi:hypothetical protein